MSEQGAKPEVLPGDLITRPGLYEARCGDVVQIIGWEEGYWVSEWNGIRTDYSSDGRQRFDEGREPNRWQLLHWVGPLPASEVEPETTTEQLAEIEAQAEPLQIREGRWRTRGGEVRHVTPTPEGDGREERFPWWDAQYRQVWRANGRYYFDGEGPLDLVEYLGPIEEERQPQEQPEPQPEPPMLQDADERIRLLNAFRLRLEPGPIEPEPQAEPEPESDAETIRDLKALYAAASKALVDAGKENTALERQLAVVKEELTTAAAVSLQLQIELDAAQQVPQAESDDELRIRLLKEANNNQAETIGRLKAEARDLNMEIGGLQRQLVQRDARIRDLETLHAAASQAAVDAGKQNDALRLQAQNQQQEYEKQTDRIAFLETLNAGNGAAISDYRANVDKLQGLVDTARGQLEADATERDELRAAIDAADKQLDQKDAQIQDLQNRLKAVAAEWAEHAETSRRLQIELDAAQQVPQPVTDEERERIWDDATEQAGRQVIRWLRPLTLALNRQPDPRFSRFMAMTLSILPDLVPELLGYAVEDEAEGDHSA